MLVTNERESTTHDRDPSSGSEPEHILGVLEELRALAEEIGDGGAIDRIEHLRQVVIEGVGPSSW